MNILYKVTTDLTGACLAYMTHGCLNEFDYVVESSQRNKQEPVKYGRSVSRVTCKALIHSHSSFTKSELMGLDIYGDKFKYKGCFQSMKELRLGHFDTLKSCYDFCHQHLFYGMTNKKVCKCADSIGEELDPEKCNITCTDEHSCGGYDAYSIYTYKRAELVGCFLYVKFEPDGINPPGNIPCSRQCYDLGHHFSGTKIELCMCGDNFSFKNQISKEQCRNSSKNILVSDDETNSIVEATTASVVVNNCDVQNGGCGELVCIEVDSYEEDDEAGSSIRCYEGDKEAIVGTAESQDNLVYKGCFTNMKEKNDFQTDSVKSCDKICSFTLFYGIKNKNVCTCSNAVEEELNAEKCDKKCSDGFSCGGISTYSVYAKFYNESMNVGCFKYLQLEHQENNSLTRPLCSIKCKELGYRFSGANAVNCQCDNKFTFKDQVNKEQCTPLSMFFTLTDVSPELEVNFKPSKYNYCINDREENMKTYCRSGVCKPGWTGALCDYRDCEENNGGCKKEMNCLEQTVNNVTINKCLCREGFTSDIFNECKKIPSRHNLASAYIYMIMLGISLTLLLITMLHAVWYFRRMGLEIRSELRDEVVTSARKQDMEIYEKRKGHKQLDEQKDHSRASYNNHS
ncbi:hypothetical protein HELRODRAFT_177750 [Helobdella robusta]|uniref:WSC domain-containing protein n=1 Tax=Helobdella robusta TaxID=6412 RepID=T1FC69_HELRO|nr:hypothetical protein HELRODRAFT_177750 [Helobdella robusta]ESN97695.1 hypothetical protein HELRODRAFT_177750 [Helobdella robusta]